MLKNATAASKIQGMEQGTLDFIEMYKIKCRVPFLYKASFKITIIFSYFSQEMLWLRQGFVIR